MPPKISPKKRATMVRLPGRILISAGEPYRAPLGATLPAKYPHQNPTAAGPPRSPADDFAIEDLNPRYTTHAIPRAQRQGDETPGPVIPTQSSIRRLNPRRDGFLARLFSADTASDTEISSQHLTAFIGPALADQRRQIYKNVKVGRLKMSRREIPSSHTLFKAVGRTSPIIQRSNSASRKQKHAHCRSNNR
ncbi:hypothetical protein OKW28_005736 [Paraburkholderia sp. 40]